MLMFIVKFVGGCVVTVFTPEELPPEGVEDFARSVPELLEDKTIQSVWMIPNFMDYLESAE